MRRTGGQCYILSIYVSLSGGALVLCSSGGQLITPVWGLVTGHHQPALCCCQEPFTPSSSLANGTSESIKTIITANLTESKEIILGGQGKHGWGVWIYLSRAWCALSQTAYYSLDLVYLSSVNKLRTAAGFSPGSTKASADQQWTGHCPCRCCILISLGGLEWLFGGKQKSMSGCVGLGTDLINNHVFTPTMA